MWNLKRVKVLKERKFCFFGSPTVDWNCIINKMFFVLTSHIPPLITSQKKIPHLKNASKFFYFILTLFCLSYKQKNSAAIWKPLDALTETCIFTWFLQNNTGATEHCHQFLNVGVCPLFIKTYLVLLSVECDSTSGGGGCYSHR